MPQSYRTPLGRVRALGAARLGTEDAWRMRVTSLALIPLSDRLRRPRADGGAQGLQRRARA